jgi:hypothetical protein
MERQVRRDSNLFAIDHDAIRAILADANRRLVERKNELCSALLRVPESLALPDHIVRAQIFARQLQDALHESRSARLSDGKPFRDATATVKAFFAQIDEPLQSAAATMRERLTEAAIRGRGEQKSHKPAGSIGIDVAGNEIIAPTQLKSSGGAPEVDINLDWEIAAVDRSKLDLEALRTHFTDSCLLTACKKHLAAQGPGSLEGVSYKQVARS